MSYWAKAQGRPGVSNRKGATRNSTPRRSLRASVSPHWRFRDPESSVFGCRGQAARCREGCLREDVRISRPGKNAPKRAPGEMCGQNSRGSAPKLTGWLPNRGKMGPSTMRSCPTPNMAVVWTRRKVKRSARTATAQMRLRRRWSESHGRCGAGERAECGMETHAETRGGGAVRAGRVQFKNPGAQPSDPGEQGE